MIRALLTEVEECQRERCARMARLALQRLFEMLARPGKVATHRRQAAQVHMRRGRLRLELLHTFEIDLRQLEPAELSEQCASQNLRRSRVRLCLRGSLGLFYCALGVALCEMREHGKVRSARAGRFVLRHAVQHGTRTIDLPGADVPRSQLECRFGGSGRRIRAALQILQAARSRAGSEARSAG